MRFNEPKDIRAEEKTRCRVRSALALKILSAAEKVDGKG
jgi:hypothetical protein